MKNPLLSKSKLPFEAIPFDKIKLSHFKPAFEYAIELGKKEIEDIKNNPDIPNFINTIERLERVGELLNHVSEVFFNLNSAETSDEMQLLAQEISPILTEYSNNISMDEDLFKRVEQAYKNTNKKVLSNEQKILLENTYKSFVRNGAKLNPKNKQILKEINTKLSSLSLKFGENVLKETKSYELWLNENDLDGLPDNEKEAAENLAQSKGGKSKYLITLDYPSYLPFMKYSKNRKLREEIFRASGSKCFKGNQYDNSEIVKEIVNLKYNKARILGYKNYSHFVLEERMAKNPNEVNDLLQNLLKTAKPLAINELNEIKKISGLNNEFKKWDFSFYAEKLRESKYSINDELLKPYFKLENVIKGAFLCAKKLYGLKFIKEENIPTYHKDVIVYNVINNKKEHIALFYADFFPRDGKRGGAWMTSYKGQNFYEGENNRPHVSIVCNFTKPTKTKPSLLTFDEVTTLFHEFGHALHGMLANTRYESLSGTNVKWDFVELPSQIMENWCYQEECLALFAKHYKTKEIIPIELINKIKESSNFLSAYQTVRQVSFGLLDLGWHNIFAPIDGDIKTIENDSMKPTEIMDDLKESCMSVSFSHIFQGGYSSGYYSYKWAEVLDADAFESFIENGVFDKKTANKFRKYILSKGGSEDPMKLFVKFKGRKPSVDALLKRSGLKK